MSQEIDGKVEHLRRTIEAAILNPDWESHDGKTFCNIATAWIASQLGCTTLKGLLANDQVAHMSSSTAWRKVAPEDAGRLANMGRLVIAAKQYPKHGHCAAVYPSGLVFSAFWNKQVPMVGNVGTKNGVMPCNHAFPVKEGMPAFYLFDA